jgi:hypothetical protein
LPELLCGSATQEEDGAQGRIVYAKKFIKQNQGFAPAFNMQCVPGCVPSEKWLITFLAGVIESCLQSLLL